MVAVLASFAVAQDIDLSAGAPLQADSTDVRPLALPITVAVSEIATAAGVTLTVTDAPLWLPEWSTAFTM